MNKMIASVFSVFMMTASGIVSAEDGLADKFVNPPMAAKPSCFWWWFNSLVDKEGITRDLEEFKDKGMGGVMLVCSGNGYGVAEMPRGPVFLSAEWRELYKHALKEADRLGLEVGLNFCGGGWCMGGAWITPQYNARWFVQSKLTLEGPQVYSDKLPLPDPREGYQGPHYGNVPHYMTWPKEKMDYRDNAIVAFREPDGAADLGVARLKSLDAKSNRADAGCFAAASSVMKSVQAPWASLPEDRPIPPGEVVDLTSKMKSDGSLEWKVPAGRWTIVRTGHVATGADVRCVLPEVGYVLEVDWLNPEALDLHFKNLGDILLGDAGKLVGKSVKYLHTDSFEDGYPNWTDALLKKFEKLRGYDPRPYLPVFAGKLVGSAEISDRFLHDYRKTVADLMADGSYGRLAELAGRNGLEIQGEAAGPSWSGTMCMDALKNLGRHQRPMGEFWQDDCLVVNGQNKVGKQTATAAHIYGRRTASAEAFTSCALPHWGDSPASLKPTADRAFCEGINRFVFHTMTCTRPQDGLPGYEYGAGTHFNPNVTWWQQGAGPWLSYVNRCQALLQSGLFVADVLYYNGDVAPNLVGPKHVDPSLGKGYDYDVCNAEVLLTRLSVKDGRLVLPDGMSYRLLVLPDTRRMPEEAVQKIRELVKAGATVVGPRPESDSGLKNYPKCDADVKQIAAELWGACDGQQVKQQTFGKGRVFWGKTLREILVADGVPSDFEHSGKDTFIDFTHRTVDGTEVYFLANRNNRAEKVSCVFRVAGRQPELWDSVTGERRELPEFEQKDGRTVVPLEFEAQQSFFIVFKDELQKKKGTEVQGRRPVKNFHEVKPVHELAGPWTVQFGSKWFYDERPAGSAEVMFEKLEDWAKRPEEAIKYYSGAATYLKVFDIHEIGNQKSKIYLSLGTVKELARVWLNGKDLGVVWCAPWRVDVTGVLKKEGNELKIEVVNLWPNRLIGDGKLPSVKRRTKTNVVKFSKGDHKLLESGLLGPVQILREF